MTRQRPRVGGGEASTDVTGVAQRPPGAVELEARPPVDRAGAMENAHTAFPTAPWTAHRPRRPQRPTGLIVGEYEEGEEEPLQ